MKIRIYAVVPALAILLLPCASFARGKAAPTAPGKYKDWNGEVDELEIVAPFKLSDFDHIIVEPLDISATPLPEPNDNTYAPVKNVLAVVTRPFAAGLAGGIGERPERPEVRGEGRSRNARGSRQGDDDGPRVQGRPVLGGFRCRSGEDGDLRGGGGWGDGQSSAPLPPGEAVRRRLHGRRLREPDGAQHRDHRQRHRGSPAAFLSWHIEIPCRRRIRPKEKYSASHSQEPLSFAALGTRFAKTLTRREERADDDAVTGRGADAAPGDHGTRFALRNPLDWKSKEPS
jgi:hypothetical protein